MSEHHHLSGLTSQEAARRLKAEGQNVLPGDQRRLWQVMLEALREPMFLLLGFAAALYLILGDLHEGLLLLVMVAFVVGLTLYQEGKTERALQALRDFSSPRALVIRDGVRQRIPGPDVVRDDLIVLEEGDRVAADSVLLCAEHLQVDESLLTGEAWAVGKQAVGDTLPPPSAPGGDGLPFVWSGTLVVRGTGIARVTATGAQTEIGRIGSALHTLTTERSPLQKEVARLVRLFATGGAVLSVFVTLVYGFVNRDWMQALLSGIAMSMSMLPEEFPVILAVFPAIGAWRLARAQVLTRRLPAIETLGAISVLCTDKTGTLTANRMTVVQVHADGLTVPLDGVADTIDPALHPRLAELAETAMFASKPMPFDPMEMAFHRLAAQTGLPAVGNAQPLQEYPLGNELRAMSMVWAGNDEDEALTVAAKGAPESIARLCRLGERERAEMTHQVEAMAAQGLRVIAVARTRHAGGPLPGTQEGFDFAFLGLLGLSDPLRPEIPQAMRDCAEAGIRVLVITGDYPATAASIAKQAGLPSQETLSGDELAQLSDTQLRERLERTQICARIRPEQKLRIVQALKADGGVVAMTGDGVNDAPALKAAHVGVAMGGRGTDVAREAAALVLLDDNFASIVHGIRLGRRIFINMQSAMVYVLAMHVPIVGMALLPPLLGWPILLYPMHIAFLELIIDPACSLAFENEPSDADAMREPPREPRQPLIDRKMFLTSMLEGVGALLAAALSYRLALESMPDENARAAGFITLVVANLMLIFSTVSRERTALHVVVSSNRTPLLVAGGALLMLLGVLGMPLVREAFAFALPSLQTTAIAVGIGAASMLWFELVKLPARWRRRQAAAAQSAHSRS